jgi:hypothetical protein
VFIYVLQSVKILWEEFPSFFVRLLETNVVAWLGAQVLKKSIRDDQGCQILFGVTYQK